MKVSLHTWSVQCWRSQPYNGWESDSSPLLRNLQQGVHKRCKYSSQDIRTCIVLKLERFQCLNFPALPIFQLILEFIWRLSFSSQAFMIIKTCVCMFVSEIVLFFPLHYKCFQKKSWFFSWFLFSPHLDVLVGYCSRLTPISVCF